MRSAPGAACPALALIAVALALAAAAPGEQWTGGGPDGAWPLPAAHAQSDTSPPEVTGVTSDVPDHTYSFGERIPITVAFNETVVVRPGSLPHLRIGLDGDPGVRVAPYSSGNNTNKLNFTYTVQDGDMQDDLQYDGTGALAGRVWDAAGNEASRTLPVPGESGSLKSSSNIRIDHASLLLVPLDSAVDGEGDFALLGGANHPKAFSVGDKTYAAVTSRDDRAVTLIRVHQNGTLSYADSAGSLGWAAHVDAFELGNATMVAVASTFYGDAVYLYRVHGNNDTLELVERLPHGTGPLAATGARGVAAFAIGDRTFIADASQYSSSVRVSRVHDNYTMAPVSLVRPPQGIGPQDLDAFAIGNSRFLFLTAESGGVNTLRVNGDGTMAVAGGAAATAAGYELRGVYGAAVVAVGGNTYAVVAAAGGHAVQAISIGADGTLAPAGLARHGDAAASDYRLPNPHDVDAFADGDRAYALAVAAGRGSHDLEYIQMIRVDGDGNLSPVRRADNSTAGLEDAGDVSGVDVFDMGGALHAIVASRSSGSAGNSVQLIRLSHTSVAGVASASGNVSLGTGGEVLVAVAFDGRVNVTGQPALLLGTGGSATYRSGSGGNVLTFNYTVGEGDNVKRLDYAGRGALQGGEIVDAGGNAVRLVLPQQGSARSLAGASEVSVHGKLPEAVSVSSPNQTDVYGAGSTILVNVTFDEPVEVTGTPLLNLTSGRNATYLSGSGGASLLFNYTVLEGDSAPDLDYTGTGALSLDGGAIADLGGGAWDRELPAPSGSLLAGADALAVDGVRPEVESVSSPNRTAAYGADKTIHVNVTFSEPVVVTGAPSLELHTAGAVNRSAAYASGLSGGASLTFVYTIQQGDASADLDYTGASALSLGAGGAIRDAAGNDADPELPARGEAGSLAHASDLEVDTVRPGVEWVSSPTLPGAYGLGDTVQIRVGFDEAVHVTGTPVLALDIGGTGRIAEYVGGSGTPSLEFDYTVRAGDRADDLGYRGAGALSGDIRDAAGNEANLELPDPGGGAPLSPGGGPILVDHAAPALIPGAVANAAGGFGRLSSVQSTVATIEVDGARYVLAGTDGVQLIRVHENGTIVNASSAQNSNPGYDTLARVYGIDAFWMNGAAYAIATSWDNHGVQLMRVHGNNDTLSPVSSLRDNASMRLMGSFDVKAFEMGANNDTYALVGSSTERGVQLIRVHGDGRMTGVDSLWDSGQSGGTVANFHYPIRLDTFRLDNGSVRALVTAYSSHAIHLLGVDEATGLTHLSAAVNGTGGFNLENPHPVAAFKLDNKWHALVGVEGGDAAVLFRVHENNGTLEPVSAAVDGEDGFGLLAQVKAISVIGGGGGSHAHALVTSASDHAIQLVRVGADGTLLPAGSARDSSVDAASPFTGIQTPHRGAATFSLAGRTYAAVASSGDGAVQFARLSLASVVNVSSAADGALVAGEGINVTVNFGEPVAFHDGDPPALLLDVGGGGPMNATYLSGNGTSSLVFNYTVQPTDTAVDLGYSGVAALSGGIRDLLDGLPADTTLPDPGSPASLSGSSDIVLDSDAPRPVSVRSEGGAGPHRIGGTIDIVVSFDKAVTVDTAGGTPTLALAVGDARRDAPYESGSGGTALVFRYTVAEGDLGLLDHGGLPISLNGGTVRAADGGGVALVLPSAPTGSLRGDGAAMAVDGVRPEVESVSSPDGAGVYGTGRVIRVNVTFDEAVIVPDGATPPSVDLGAGRSAAYASGSSTPSLLFEYEVGPGDTSPNLDYASVSALGPDGSVVDAAGNTANLGLPPPGSDGLLGAGGAAIVVDGVIPEVDAVSAPGGTGVHGLGDTVRIRVDFGKAVNVTGAPALLLHTGGAGGINRSAIYESGSGTQNLTFAYGVGAGDRSGDLAYAGAGALSGNITDARTGAPAVLALPGPGGGAPLSAAGPVLVDHAAPVLILMGSAVNGTGGFDGLDSANRVSAVKAGGAQYLLVASNPSYAPDAVQLIRVHENGTMEAADSARNGTGGFDTLTSLGGIKAFTMNGTAWAIVTSSHPSLPEPAVGNEGVQLIRINGSSGALEAADSLNKADDAGLLFEDAFRVDVVEAGVGDGRATYALVTSNDFTGSRGVQMIRVHGSGTLEAAGSVESAASGGSLANFAFPYDVDAFRLENGSARALVTEYTNKTLHLFAVNGTGGLEALSYAKDGAGGFTLSAPDAVAAFDQAGEWRALVGGEPNYLQLVRVHDGSGTLAPVSAVRDGGPEGFDALNKPRGLAVFGAGGGGGGGGTYAVSTAEDESSVQLARVGAGGALLPAGSITAPGGRTAEDGLLSNPQGVDTFELGGRTYAAVASPSGNSVTLIRLTLASVESVSSPNATGAHAAGAPIVVNVTFGEPVAFADGAHAPELLLDAGGMPRNATYLSGNATSSLIFNYTVRAGDNDGALGYGGTAALSGDIRDLDGHPADATLPPPGGSGSLSGSEPVALDTAQPRVLSVSSPNASRAYGIGSAVAVNVTFGEPVWVEGGPPSVAIRMGDGTTRAAVYSSGSGGPSLLFSYTVATGDASDGLDHAGLPIDLGDGGSIRDAAGNDADTALPAPAGSLRAAGGGGPVAVDGTRPTVSSASSPDAPGPYGIGRIVRIDVNFSMPVTVGGDGPPFLALAGGLGAAYDTGSGTKSLRFEYAVREGDEAPRLDYANASALVLNGSTIRDAAGNDADTDLPEPSGSLAAGGAIRVDGVRPEAESVSTPNRTGTTYYPNQRVHVHVAFGENVTVGAGVPPPSVALDAGGAAGARAAYVSGGGSDTLVFAYDARRGDDTAALDYAGESALDLGGAAIMDAAGNDARPGLPARGEPGSRIAAARIAVETPGASVVSVTSPDDDGAYAEGARINITVAFSGPVVVAGGPPLLRLDVGGAGRDAVYESGSGTPVLAFAYEVRPGDRSARLSYAAGSSIVPNGGSIAAGAAAGGGQAGLHLPFPGLPASLSGSTAITIGAATAEAEAVAAFTGPRTVRIDYTAPLGPPAGHGGPVYGAVSIGAAGAQAETAPASGLGTRTHIVRLAGGAAAGPADDGSVRLLVGLEGSAGGVPYAFPAGVIPVRPGEDARTLSPPGAAPSAAIEEDGFVRALNATAAGDGARPAINVTGLAAPPGAGAQPPPGAGAGRINATLPSDARVAIIASFAEVSFPPNANATGVPADGLIELYVSPRAPTEREIADGLGIDEADILEVRRVVEAGDDAARIEFNLPVRILLAGQADGRAFYVGAAAAAAAVSPIEAECEDDDTDAVHAQLKGSGECQIDSGADKVIYTYHLTRFGTARVAEFAGAASECAAVLPAPEVSLGGAGPGERSAAAAQEVRRAGALPLDAVSVTAGAWTDADGGMVMPASATSARPAGSGGAWTPLGGGASVALELDASGRSASAEFRVDVPRDALPDGATSPAVASQSVTYTVTCTPPG